MPANWVLLPQYRFDWKIHILSLRIGPAQVSPKSNLFRPLDVVVRPRAMSSLVKLSLAICSLVNSPDVEYFQVLLPDFGTMFKPAPVEDASADMPVVCTAIACTV